MFFNYTEGEKQNSGTFEQKKKIDIKFDERLFCSQPFNERAQHTCTCNHLLLNLNFFFYMWHSLYISITSPNIILFMISMHILRGMLFFLNMKLKQMNVPPHRYNLYHPMLVHCLHCHQRNPLNKGNTVLSVLNV